MSYQHYPPPGYGCAYPPPPGYPSAHAHAHAHAHPPQYIPVADPYSYPQPQPQPQPQPGYQGYFAQDQYPPPSPSPSPQSLPYQVYHCEHDDDCSSFLKGCFAAFCFCCVLEECF